MALFCCVAGLALRLTGVCAQATVKQHTTDNTNNLINVNHHGHTKRLNQTKI
jgi:hypothetical protein